LKSLVSVEQPLMVGGPGEVAALEAATSRVAAFVSLTKPRLVFLVLVTVAVGFLLGARGSTTDTSSLARSFAATLMGTALVAGGAGALNQCLERVRDGRMRRTATRALPTGRLSLVEAVWFGSLIALLGAAILAFATNPLAAAIACSTLVLYDFVYTPLKSRTSLNTVIGAIPGALPPVIGWAAATGRLGVEALALFLIVFLWQFPHFLAIAWIYRDDYRRAGFRMLTGNDSSGRITGCQATTYALVLVPVGLLPATVGLAGPIYFAGAFVLGLVYVSEATRFWLDVSDHRARRLLRASFVYLPAILLLLLLNPVPL
jgi:protoheme IX farnesyltransferase